LPLHEIRLKVGAPIIAMRNIATGVSNGNLDHAHPRLQQRLVHILAVVGDVLIKQHRIVQ